MHIISNTLAILSFGLAGCALAHEGASPGQPAPPATSSLSRAEVLADLQLWHRAGMTHLPLPAAGYEASLNPAEYERGLQRYRQLRDGPAYREAVRSLQGSQPPQ